MKKSYITPAINAVDLVAEDNMIHTSLNMNGTTDRQLAPQMWDFDDDDEE